MNIFVLVGTVITSTVASAFSVLQQPVESTELIPLVIEAHIPESVSAPAVPTQEPEISHVADGNVLAALDTSLKDIPQPDIGTAQLVTAAPPTHIPAAPVQTNPSPSPTATPTATLTPPPPSPTAPSTPTPTPIQSWPTTTPTKPAEPSATPTPTRTLLPISLTSTTPAPPPAHSLNSDTILSLINAHRATKSLPPFQKEEKLCALAQSRGPELYNEIFVTKNVHAGFYSRKLPYWITENMAHYGSEEIIVKWWLGSGIHRRAIEGNYTYSCGACYGNSCAQMFTSYTPK